MTDIISVLALLAISTLTGLFTLHLYCTHTSTGRVSWLSKLALPIVGVIVNLITLIAALIAVGIVIAATVMTLHRFLKVSIASTLHSLSQYPHDVVGYLWSVRTTEVNRSPEPHLGSLMGIYIKDPLKSVNDEEFHTLKVSWFPWMIKKKGE